MLDSKRQPLIEKLDFYNKEINPSPAQSQTVERLKVFIKENINCFDRECYKGHVTGSAWVVNHAMTKHALLLHKKLEIWVQPGGHCDGDPDTLRTAIKETEEELGLYNLTPMIGGEILDVDIHLIPEKQGVAPHYHYDVRYLLQAAHRADIFRNNESIEARWFTTEEIRNLEPNTDLSVLRMLAKADQIIANIK